MSARHTWIKPEPDEPVWEARLRTGIRWAVWIVLAFGLLGFTFIGLGASGGPDGFSGMPWLR